MSKNPLSQVLSFLPTVQGHRRFSLVQGRAVSPGQLFFQAHKLSLRLPHGNYAVNRCQNRYLFTLCYLAVLFKGQVNLLPQNQSPGCLQKLRDHYSGLYCISDDPACECDVVVVALEELDFQGNAAFPAIPKNRIASISFTSGSTGMPKEITKTLGEFLKSARLATERLGIARGEKLLLSTVPAQHMYGLESSVFWPLVADATIQSERPFFPEDIRRNLAQADQPCILISTPTHLKACVESKLRWSNLAGVISSTAMMPSRLAASIENTFQAPLLEIFGSTETLSFATRRRTHSERWRPYAGVQVEIDDLGCTVQGGHLAQAVHLDDRVEVHADGCFILKGRSSDLVKIGGKRASLSELNRLINEIDGVRDGLFYRTEHGRLGVLVVSRRSRKSILEELRRSIDDVFLPRRFHRIPELPRNDLGKISSFELNRLIGELDIA